MNVLKAGQHCMKVCQKTFWSQFNKPHDGKCVGEKCQGWAKFILNESESDKMNKLTKQKVARKRSRGGRRRRRSEKLGESAELKFFKKAFKAVRKKVKKVGKGVKAAIINKLYKLLPDELQFGLKPIKDGFIKDGVQGVKLALGIPGTKGADRDKLRNNMQTTGTTAGAGLLRFLANRIKNGWFAAGVFCDYVAVIFGRKTVGSG